MENPLSVRVSVTPGIAFSTLFEELVTVTPLMVIVASRAFCASASLSLYPRAIFKSELRAITGFVPSKAVASVGFPSASVVNVSINEMVFSVPVSLEVRTNLFSFDPV
ncbi:hypothetical protein D3C71_1740430 [compost metagenome]